MMSKFLIKVLEKDTKILLKYTSYNQPVETNDSVSFNDKNNLFKRFPKELFAIQIEEVFE
jgi:hypothetical protein